LVTLTFGVLMDNLVFTLNIFANSGGGVIVHRPSFASGDRAFSYLAFGAFCLFAVVIVNLRRSTTGLAIAAVRWSEPASRTMGLGVVQTKVMLTAFAAFVAGVGGGLLVLYNNNALPSSFATLGGLVWLAVLVTVGVRSNVAAAVAGVGFALIPALFVNYLPVSVAEVPTALFGLGAILVTRNPDGVVAMHGRQLNWLGRRVLASWRHPQSHARAVSGVGPRPSETNIDPTLNNSPGR
jgi:branched-chain amino acid transport system permease protein